MGNFLSLKFWFSMRPGEFASTPYLAGLLGILIIAAIVFYMMRRQDKSLYRLLWIKLFSFSLYNAIIAAFLLFFTYEMIVFLSARFWFLFWGIGIIVWIYFIIRFALSIPKLREQQVKEKEYKKYIP